MSATIDPTAALVVIDLQRGILATPTQPYTVEQVVERTARLAEAFRASGRRVVWVTVDGAPSGRTDASRGMQRRQMPAEATELVPEAGALDDELHVMKHGWGAFHTTDLDARLREAGVTQVVLTGVATHMGVESTARSAHELGYDVALVEDAMAARETAEHEYAVTRIFPRLGEVTDTQAVLAQLA